MTLDDLQRAYQAESGRTDAIDDALQAVFSHPDQASDAFFFSIIDDYQPEDRSFWIRQAVTYANKAADRRASQARLEAILEQPQRYWNLGALLGTIATQLGRIAEYPNQVLGRTIEYPGHATTDSDRMVLKMLRAGAFGAYVATATDFHYGRNAGNEVESRNLHPTLAMAEDVIARYSAG